MKMERWHLNSYQCAAIAKMVGVSEWTVRHYAETGFLPHHISYRVIHEAMDKLRPEDGQAAPEKPRQDPEAKLRETAEKLSRLGLSL